MEQERKERIARNEVTSRDLNERLGIRAFVCECGDLDCGAVVQLPLDIYRSVRVDDRRFIISPGHNMPEVEDVVMRRENWAVVRKRDEVAHVVERA